MKLSDIKITQALFGKLSIKPYRQKVKKNILFPKTVADQFNQFFLSVGKNTADVSIRLAEENNITVEETPLETVYMPSQDLFSFWTVTSEEVCRVIASLPLNKSPGPDKINSRILKDCLPVILSPLIHSLLHGRKRK
jgi:hypothetical protein